MRAFCLQLGVASLIAMLALPGCAVIAYGGDAAGGSGAGSGAGGEGLGGAAGGVAMGGAGGGAGGCDANLDEDPEHCGSCGHDCFGGECDAGVCQPVELWASVQVDPNERFAQGITIAEDQIVWTSGEGILSLPISTQPGAPPFVVSSTPGTRIMYESPLLFRTWGTLITTPLGGGNDGVWGSGQCNRELTRDAQGNTFCVEANGMIGRLFRYNASFSATPIAVDLPDVFGVAVDGTHVYVGTGAGLLRMPKDAASPTPENVHPWPVPSQVVREGSSLYFGGDGFSAGQGLLRMDDGETVELVPSVSPGSIHVDDSHIYFGDWGNNTLWRVDLDGQNPRTWTLEPPYADVLAGDEQFLFFTTDEDGRLFRLRK